MFTSYSIWRVQRFGTPSGYDYIRCVIWDEKAQYVVDHFEKGQSVSIEGSVRGRFYPNRSGTTSYAMEVYPEHMVCEDSSYSF